MSTLQYKTEWDLTRYYQSLQDPQIQKDIDQVEQLIDTFVETYKGKITTQTPKDFIDFFELDSQIDTLITKIHVYLSYLSSLDTQNQDVLKQEGEFTNFIVEQSNKLLFVSQEFKALGYDALMALSEKPELQAYQNFFVQKAESIKYLLDEKTEYALNLKSPSGEMSFSRLYEELTGSLMFTVRIDGETKQVTEEEVRSMRMSPDEEVRKEAYRSIREVYNTKQNQITLGNTYSAIVKDATSDIKLRGFKGVMSPRNLSEQLPDEAVDMLLEEVQNAYPLFQRYLKVKAKLLGKTKMMNWDLFAPIDNSEKNYPFEDSLELYLDTLKEFDQEFYEYSREMFTDGRVDVFPKPGKRGGAYCSYAKGFQSIVLLNYTSKKRDVSTIAHELGHAIHGYFSQQQPGAVYHTGMSLAETASVFNETLLNDALLKRLTDTEKVDFLENQLQDIFSTISRQIQYTVFEKRVHETILSGKELSYEDYNRMWREEQVKMSGDIVDYDVDGSLESAWSAIPHIFRTPFYCYSYAFGNILSFALYEQYLEQGQSFVEKYKNILRSGGSKKPYDLLIENGLDITKREFYQKGLKVVEHLVEEFEKVAG